MTLALQLQMTALVSLLDEKGVIDRQAFLEHCRHTIAETQHVNKDTDWVLVCALIEGDVA